MNRGVKVLMEDAVLVKNRIYFFSKEWNALYTADLKSGEIKFIDKMPEENVMAGRLCAGIMHYNEKLVLVPMTAKKIWIYDLKKSSWQSLTRRKMVEGNGGQEMFRAVEYKGDLFFIGSNYPAIIRMNPDYELEYWISPYAFLKSVPPNGCYFRADFALVENYLFLASCQNPFVLRLDLDMMEFAWFRVGEDDFRYSGITWDGESFWLSPRTATPIIKWDGKDKTEYFTLPDKFDRGKYNFLGVQYDDGKLIFPGMFQNCTIVMDPGCSGDMEFREERYTFYRCFGGHGLLSQTVDGLLQWKDPDQKRSGKIDCELPLVYVTEYLKKQIEKAENSGFEKDILAESFSFTLPLYLSMIGQGRETKNRKSTMGEIVWRNIRS